MSNAASTPKTGYIAFGIYVGIVVLGVVSFWIFALTR